METPSSTTRRITRSQTKAAAASNGGSAINSSISMSMFMSKKNNKKMESKQRNEKRDRSTALIDITNGSPIVGVAMGNLKTPSLSMAKKKKKDRPILTPCSGESLLRGQVKTLLKKVVHEEDEKFPNFTLGHPLFLHLQKVVESTSQSRVFPAPTPANTPHAINLSSSFSNGDKKGLNVNSSLASVTPIVHQVQEDFRITQGVVTMDGLKQAGSLESQRSLVSRSLLFEFSDDKSETSDHSSSVCSNNIMRYDQEIKSNGDQEHERDSEEEEEEDSTGSMMMIDELCEGVRQITVNDQKGLVGSKHIRFVYNSDEDNDDETQRVEEEEEEEEDDREISFISWGSVSTSSSVATAAAASGGILRLKGVPTPVGKHLRFHIDEEEED